MVIFGLSGAIHLYQMIRSRRWAYFAVICAAGLEIYGWYLRYGSASDVMYGCVNRPRTPRVVPSVLHADHGLHAATSCSLPSSRSHQPFSRAVFVRLVRYMRFQRSKRALLT